MDGLDEHYSLSFSRYSGSARDSSRDKFGLVLLTLRMYERRYFQILCIRDCEVYNPVNVQDCALIFEEVVDKRRCAEESDSALAS